MLCHSNLVRKNMIDKLRKKGNFLHNKDVKTSGTGELKLRRQPKKNYSPKDYVDCIYCKGMHRFVLLNHQKYKKQVTE